MAWRRTLATSAALMATGAFAEFAGCSNSNTNPSQAADGGRDITVTPTVTLPDAAAEVPFTWQEVKIAGKITLPAGVAANVASLKVNGLLSSATPSADGSFEVSGTSSGRQGVTLTDTSGKLVLLGWIRPGQANVLSTREAATYLLWLHLGASRFPASAWDSIVDLVAKQKQVDDLAAFLDEKLKANLNYLELSNDTDRAAIGKKLDQLLAELTPGSPPTKMVLVNPTDTKSGVTVLIGDKDGTAASDVNQITLMNEWRHRAHVFIGRNIDGQIVPESDFELLPTNGLNGAIGSVNDVIAGNGAYTPVYYGPVGLGTVTDENDVRKYQLRMVGPGLDPGTGANLTESQKSKRSFVSMKAFLLDLFLPAFFAVGSFEWVHHMLGSSFMGEFVKELVAQTYSGNLINIGNLVYNGDYKGAMLGLANTLQNNDEFRKWFFETLREKVMAKLFNNENAVAYTKEASTKALAALAIVDKVLGVYDYLAVWRDVARSNAVEDWDLTVRAPKVIFTPAQASVACAEKTGFRVSIKNAGQTLSKDITYKFESSPTLGHFTSGSNSTYKDSFESTDPTIYYTSNPGGTSGGTDEITVTAIQKVAQDKGPTVKIELGKAKAKAKVEATCQGSSAYLGTTAYTSGCTVTLTSPGVVHPGDEVSIGVQAGYGGVCGSAYVYMSHAVAAKLDTGTWQTTSGGTGGVYDFCYTGDAQPMVPGGVSVALPDGNAHAITFKIDPDLKCPSCIREVVEGTPCSSNPGNHRNISGPAVVMGGNGGTHGWSTVRFFGIEVKK